MKSNEIIAYGTEEEVIVKTAKGIFLIQSPDLTVEYEELDRVPVEFEELDPSLFGGFEIPADLLEGNMEVAPQNHLSIDAYEDIENGAPKGYYIRVLPYSPDDRIIFVGPFETAGVARSASMPEENDLIVNNITDWYENMNEYSRAYRSFLNAHKAVPDWVDLRGAELPPWGPVSDRLLLYRGYQLVGAPYHGRPRKSIYGVVVNGRFTQSGDTVTEAMWDEITLAGGDYRAVIIKIRTGDIIGYSYGENIAVDTMQR